MPVGPSHSRSRGGSFRGSGSSRGGGFSFGGGSSSRRRHGGGTFVFLGRPVSIDMGIWKGVVSIGMFVIFLGFLLIVSIGMSYTSNVNLKYAKNQVTIMKEDAVYYADLLQKADAEVDGYYKTTGHFTRTVRELDDDDYDMTRTGIYEWDYVDGVMRYFVVYRYYNVITGKETTAHTYATYSQANVSSLQSTGEISIAYTYDEGDASAYSINVGYSLEKNMEYKAFLQDKANYNKMFTIFIIADIVIAGLLILLVVCFVKKLKSTLKVAKEKREAEAAKEQAEVEVAEAKADEAQRMAKQKGRVCAYCRADVPDGDEVCPGCGSRTFN